MVDTIVTAFNTATPSLLVESSHGRGLQADEIADRLQVRDVLNILVGVDIDPESIVHRSTSGAIVEGRALMYSFAKNDKGAVDGLRTWWRTIAPGVGTTILHNIETRTTLGSLTVYRWRAIGGFKDSATRWGDIWLSDQLVEYTIKI